MSNLNNQAIDDFVEELLNDPETNIYLLPDAIERPLYANLLKLMFHSLEKAVKSFKVDFIGHEIKIVFEPKSEGLRRGSDESTETESQSNENYNKSLETKN